MLDVPQWIHDRIFYKTYETKQDLQRRLTGEQYEKVEEIIEVYERLLLESFNGTLKKEAWEEE